ncbi:acid protease [Suillus decipiens]|nr:acid protease [Suillus decipiens]
MFSVLVDAELQWYVAEPSIRLSQTSGLLLAGGSTKCTTVLNRIRGEASLWRVVESLHNYDGILGIGPVALTVGTLVEAPAEPIPTVANNLCTQLPEIIPADVLGIFFQPYSNSALDPIGQLTFGGTDSNLYNGHIAYTPITDIDPASNSWGIEQSITYGIFQILPTTTGIIDCGSSLIAIATEGFQLYKAITGGRYDAVTELLVISDDQFNALQPLKFHTRDGQTYILTPNAQIWPRSLNTVIDGEMGSVYLIVSDLGEEIGEGDYDFIIGLVFMQRFYTVLDATNSQVGFATTPFTDATTN